MAKRSEVSDGPDLVFVDGLVCREVRAVYSDVAVPAARMSGPEAMTRIMRGVYGNEPQERFVVALLNARHWVSKADLVTVSVGTLTASLVHPREVFAMAVAQRAAAVIIAHTHPSGDPTASAEDREVTKRLVRAGALLGIPVLDHVIVAASGYFSFREAGEISQTDAEYGL
jgi:DNA repair protein RadC